LLQANVEIEEGGDMVDTVNFSLLAEQGARLRSFKAGEIIFKEGDRGDEMFVIQSGQVEIRRGNRVLETLVEKNIFGEMALIDDGPRSASAVAATDVSLVPVGEKQFLFLVSETPYFALNVMRTLVRRLRTMNEAV
jgi:CRP/FNR family cyclic AMP-dependent transcriptional regulator